MASDTPSIYRFKYSNDIIKLINEFAVIHQYDDRKSYKEFWEKWVQENESDLQDEITRLNRLGYEGNIIDKMFKAGRYYFRKKNLNKSTSTQPQERRTYITMEHEVLDAMDNHISLSIKNPDFTPASGYTNFCTTNITLLKNEIDRLCAESTIDSTELSDKIKKTYKNRYFLLTHKK